MENARNDTKAHITLIDLSEGMLEIAKERFRDNPNVKYGLFNYE